MRRFILIPITIIVLYGCEALESETSFVTVLSDRTDPTIEKPNPKEITELLGLKHDPNRGIDFSFQVIGNVDYRPVSKLPLEPHSLLNNDFERSFQVEQYMHSLDSLITSENQKDFLFKSSSILRPLVAALESAANSGATHKSVLLYSDLQEISDVFSVLDAATQSMLLENPQEFASDIQENISIYEYLDGITLNIIYYPTTRAQNRAFRDMLVLYELLFKHTGLQISVGTSSLKPISP